ncbi:hypothetical protein L209DRAFT_686675, partial [Thermothelomyces heterothallicus CBS 203.75]
KKAYYLAKKNILLSIVALYLNLGVTNLVTFAIYSIFHSTNFTSVRPSLLL